VIDISGLSSRYAVRRMGDGDAEDILAFCLENDRYYRYCGKQPSLALVLSDMHITPPGKDAASKYYVGFFDGATLAAVMDLIDGYPEDDCAYIGFFMVNRALQGRHIGTGIIREVCAYLKRAGFAAVHLAIDKGNPPAVRFWKKNGFEALREVERDGGTLLVAVKAL